MVRLIPFVPLFIQFLYATSSMHIDTLNTLINNTQITSIKHSNPMKTIKRLLEFDNSKSVEDTWSNDQTVLYIMKSLTNNLANELPYLKYDTCLDDQNLNASLYIYKIARQLVHIFYKYQTIPLYEYKHVFIDLWNKYAQLFAYHIDFKEAGVALRPWEYFLLDQFNPMVVIYLTTQGFCKMWHYLPDSLKVALGQARCIINSTLETHSRAMPRHIFQSATNHELPHVREMMKRTMQVCCKNYWDLDFLPQIVLIQDKIYNVSLPPIVHKQRILSLAKRIFNSSISSIIASATYLLINNYCDDSMIQDLDNQARLIMSQLGLIRHINLSNNRLAITAQLIQSFAILAVHLLYKHNGFIPNEGIKLFSTWTCLVERLPSYLTEPKLFDTPHPWEKYLLLMYEKYSIPDCQSIKEEIDTVQATLGQIMLMYHEFTPHTKCILDEAIKVVFAQPATFTVLETVFNDQRFLKVYSYLAFMLTRLIMYCTIVNAV